MAAASSGLASPGLGSPSAQSADGEAPAAEMGLRHTNTCHPALVFPEPLVGRASPRGPPPSCGQHCGDRGALSGTAAPHLLHGVTKALLKEASPLQGALPAPRNGPKNILALGSPL